MTFEEMLFKYKNVYYGFPQPLKTFLGSLYGKVPLSVRFGNGFNTHTKIIHKFEDGSEQFKLDYMYSKTLETLLFAEKNIPYYTKLFNEHSISTKDFKSLVDIKLFPMLTKQIIKKNLNLLYSDIIEKPVAYYSGGSLSTPTQYFLPTSSRAKEKAYNNYIFSKINYHYRDRTLLLKGREISDPEHSIYWDYEPIDNYFLLSNNYMNSDKFSLMHTKALSFKPKFIFGYPSAVLSFIRQSKKYNLKKLKIEGIILASESVYKNELEFIRDYFNVDILTHYGHTERNVIGYRLNDNNYNLLNSYGLTRVVNNEIITTTFDNFVMPFINYETNDHTSGNLEFYNDTDIIKKAENIDGRTQDYLVTKDERLISITTMCGGQHLPLEKMEAIQYIQETPGKVTVLVEGDENINLQEVEKGMCKLVRDGIDFDIKRVDKIEKTHRGKRVMCKQFLKV